MARVTRSISARATASVSDSGLNGQSMHPLSREGPKPIQANGKRKAKAEAATGLKRVKKEPDDEPFRSTPKFEDKQSSVEDIKPLNSATALSPSKVVALQAKKLQALTRNANTSPFPDFPRPTPEECRLAHKILSDLHGERIRPTQVKASTTRAGCGDSPSVLDALVRTVLSQNTSNANSTRAKLSMDAAYGGSDEWEKIVEGGQAKLQEAIKCGGLSAVKSKVIINILQQAREKYGEYSLDHLFESSNDDAMKELVSFQGVGPKTASCVLLFCLQRDSFAVDTHVWRITGLLGWRPQSATRDETYAHLDARIPASEKYGLHVLLVTHGRVCDECKAGGKRSGKCELRKAFK